MLKGSRVGSAVEHSFGSLEEMQDYLDHVENTESTTTTTSKKSRLQSEKQVVALPSQKIKSKGKKGKVKDLIAMRHSKVNSDLSMRKRKHQTSLREETTVPIEGLECQQRKAKRVKNETLPKLNSIKGSELYSLYSFPKSSLSREMWEEHKKCLTLIPINEYEERKRKKHWKKPNSLANAKNAIYCYAETDDSYGVPAAYGIEMFGIPETDKRPHGSLLNADVGFTAQLFDEKGLINQQRIVEVVVEYCLKSPIGGILCIPTGSGKTVIGEAIIYLLKKRALWLVPAEALLDQSRARVRQFMPHARIGLIRGSTFDIEDKDIVFVMVQSLAMHDYGIAHKKRLYELYEIVIIDEVHTIPTRVLSKAMDVIGPVRTKIGMTATLERADGMEKMLLWTIGPVLISVPPVNVASEFTDVQKLNFSDGEQKVSTMSYQGETVPNFAAMTNDLCEDVKRNEVLVEIISKLIYSGRHVLVFTSRVNHSENLYKWLQEQEVPQNDPEYFNQDVWNHIKTFGWSDHLVNGYMNMFLGTMKDYKKIKIFKRGMKKEERERIDQTNHDCIIGTYKILSTGLDLKYIDTLVLADPVKNNMQTIGRLRYKMNQDVRFLIVDLCDQFSIFRSQAAKRSQTYKQKKLVILKTKDWSEYVDELQKKIATRKDHFQITTTESCKDSE